MKIKFFRDLEKIPDQQCIIIELLELFVLTDDQLKRIKKIIDER